jgi:ribonucleotide reductase alpha subunit
MANFHLSDNFLSDYIGVQPNWGPLGFVTYKRTYARPIEKEGRTEEWWETCKRVVEGTYQIQKEHCDKLRLPWNGHKAQRSAQEMFKLMWDFKFLPPGRGLWMMGTDFVKKKGGGALNNPLGEDTMILTQEHGWTTIGELEGQKVTLLSNTKLYGRDNSTTAQAKWVKADISHAEMHPSYELIYKDKFGQETKIISSQNHRWFRRSSSKKPWERVVTEELKVGDYLPMTKPPKYYKLSLEGAQHGFFFGDGTRSNGELHQFTEDNREILNKLWPADRINKIKNPDKKGLGHDVVRQCPTAWGSIPSKLYKNDKRYLYGFLAGYIAADGHVNKKGDVLLTSARLTELDSVRQLFILLGIRATEPRIMSTRSNLVDNRNPLYVININPSDLDEQFFLKEEALKRWKSNLDSNRRDWLKLVSIKRLSEEHRVLCATVPEYEQFVIEGFCLTSNCSFISTKELSTDFAAPFCFLMDMSMLGVGVGGDTKGTGAVKIREPRQGDYVFTVEDTREGWVELVRTHLNAYAGLGAIPSKNDFSKIRPYGAPIKGFGGTASGPGPLQELVEVDIPSILQPLAENESMITSDAIVDIFNAIGKCVVSGNVRRSAEIVFGSPDDETFLELKNPEINADKLNRWRWASNNSIFANIGMDYSHVAERTAKNGEPGYIWLDTARAFGRLSDPPNYADQLAEGANPCSEQTLESYELCCLVETFPARHDTFEEYIRTLKFAYLYAKTVTLLPTHNERTNAVMLRNRRIGTSQSGIVQSLAKHGVREHFQWSDKGYQYLRKLDKIYSRWLCIPESVKVTSVKPSGTISLLPGATPGIHFPYGEYYWRTIRFDKGSPLVQPLREAGYKVVNLTNEHNTVVVYFPIKEDNFYKGRKDVTIWEQLELAAQMQYYWADNQVSVTVTFSPEEAKEIKQALEFYETRLKSVSFLPLTDHGFEHAPYQPMSKKEYKKAIKKLKPIQWIDTIETEGFKHKFCDSDKCEIPQA